jgi:hypothetical protein
MARGNFESRVVAVRLDRKQKALDEALLVPWPQLEAAVLEYIDWHSFVLWVRAVAEAAGELPDRLRSELCDRCPGFLESVNARNRSLWKSLDEWITASRFAAAKDGGWFDALMYYAYAHLRFEQAWTLWARSSRAWEKQHPAQWPTFAEWREGVAAVAVLEEDGSEKARALAGAANVDPRRLNAAVSDVIDQRAFAFWVDSVSEPGQRLDEAVLNEGRQRFPTLGIAEQLPWGRVLFFRLIRDGESAWRKMARAENWYAALRYHVGHHPRYQRLIHYRERCHDEWLRVRPISFPAFQTWLTAADGYTVRPAA